MKITVEKVFIVEIHAAKLRQKKYVMTDTRKQDEPTALAHWTYSRDEWNHFLKWKKRKKGFLFYLMHRLFSKSIPRTPQVKISVDTVSIDGNHEPFLDESRQLKRIEIRDTGTMNVMEIGYERSLTGQVRSAEIHIPVPKGKLREAIQIKERIGKGL